MTKLQTRSLLSALAIVAALLTVCVSADELEAAGRLQSEPESISPGADESAAPADQSDHGIRAPRGKGAPT